MEKEIEKYFNLFSKPVIKKKDLKQFVKNLYADKERIECQNTLE